MKFNLFLGIVVGILTAVLQTSSYAQSPACYNTSCAAALRVCNSMSQDFDFYAGNDAPCIIFFSSQEMAQAFK
jgi:hypothetical protein